ncbi:MAG TPA: MoxR family ATPase [Thermoanaerobaculia bacterium]|nr:MoxR family ATPase [Thermoanaerobaculia bacterium]
MSATWKQYGRETPALERAPAYEALPGMEDPAFYHPSEELAAAVNVAVTLGLPLLVTGKPGCGKTDLAYHVAHKFGQEEPLRFDAKTTSTAQDLFYRYDALRHFQAASVQRELRKAGALAAPASAPQELTPEEQRKETMRYIELQALGIAALLASTDPDADSYLPLKYRGLGPRRSVVLIDEIDKAPRDLPNDILREIVSLSFTLRETGEMLPPGGIDPTFRPIVILTSNSEKSLPDAFLRRCAFFHIDPPDTTALEIIVTERLVKRASAFPGDAVEEAVKLFDAIRNAKLRKEPSTAELLQWARMLGKSGKTPADVRAGDDDALRITCAVMATEDADREKIRKAATAR